MPTGMFASFYWPGDGGSPPPPANSSLYHHPYWFDGSTLGSGVVFPTLPVPRQRQWWEHYVKRLKCLRYRIWQHVPRRIQVSILALRLIWSGAFDHARREVDRVSVDPSSRTQKEWRAEHAARIAADPNVSENICRFLSAYSAMPQSIPRDHRTLLVNLAYLGRKHG